MSDRDDKGRYLKGHSPHPSAGRPKGFKGVAKQIMRLTEDGAAMVKWAMEVWQNQTSSMADRRWAFEWLSDRGLGKPVARTELEATIAHATSDDDRPLTDAQYAAFGALFGKDTDDSMHTPASGPH